MKLKEVEKEEKFLRLTEVENMIGYKKSKIYIWVEEGSFPAPVRAGVRTIRWKRSEVISWMEKLPTEFVQKNREKKVSQCPSIIENGEEFILKCKDGSECIIHRIIDGGITRTVVFLPEGPVVNSIPGRLHISLQKKDCMVEIETMQGIEEDISFEKITISKDQLRVHRSFTTDEKMDVS